VTNLYLGGERVQGSITCAAGGDIDLLEMFDCFGANAKVSTGYTNLANFRMNAGNITMESAASTLEWEQAGGTGVYDVSGTPIKTLKVWTGKLTVEDGGVGTGGGSGVVSGVVRGGNVIAGGHKNVTMNMDNLVLAGGVYDESSPLANITHTNADPVVRGGTYIPSTSSTVTTS
jgi:hypothetical protein